MKTLTVSVLPLLLLFSFCFQSSHSKGKDCTRYCGSINVIYPFGIEEGCYLQAEFKVTCDQSVTPAVLTLDLVQLPIQKIEIPDQVILLIKGKMAVDKPNGSSSSNASNADCIKLEFPFTVSGRWTKFVAMGCNAKAYVSNNGHFMSGCESQWMLDDAGDTDRGGLGHCRSKLPDNQTQFCYNVTNLFNYNNSSCANSYSFAGLAVVGQQLNESILKNYTGLVDANDQLGLPLAVDWAIEGSKTNGGLCGRNTFWNMSSRGSGGYVCYCKDNGNGNPYLKGNGGCQPQGAGDPGLKYALAGLALAVCLLGASWSYNSFLEKKLATIRYATFSQNGGPTLQNIISSNTVVQTSTGFPPPSFTGGESMLADAASQTAASNAQNPTIFTQENLEKAIKLLKKGSDLTMRIRQQRQGIRSTGVLQEGRKIDMRPFKMEEKEKFEPFLKEIITLRRINHPNVVKLQGCCLETNPDQWLVYDYVSDRTLHSHLHENPDLETRLSWQDRLKIAKGTASALAYLHECGIWHRDVRSSNILLDTDCEPKVVEFGVGRVLSSASYVNRTIGYLDPEYTHAKQLTEKSDVYGFGVVLVELLTGQDPNSDQRNQKDGSLTMHFISEMNQNHLELVVEDGLLMEAGMDQLRMLAELAENCLKFSRNERPAMSEVNRRLCLIGDGDGQGADRAPEEGGEGKEDNGDDGNEIKPMEEASNVVEIVTGEKPTTSVINIVSQFFEGG